MSLLEHFRAILSILTEHFMTEKKAFMASANYGVYKKILILPAVAGGPQHTPGRVYVLFLLTSNKTFIIIDFINQHNLM